jgi:hypothetical protein
MKKSASKKPKPRVAKENGKTSAPSRDGSFGGWIADLLVIPKKPILAYVPTKVAQRRLMAILPHGIKMEYAIGELSSHKGPFRLACFEGPYMHQKRLIGRVSEFLRSGKICKNGYIVIVAGFDAPAPKTLSQLQANALGLNDISFNADARSIIEAGGVLALMGKEASDMGRNFVCRGQDMDQTESGDWFVTILLQSLSEK